MSSTNVDRYRKKGVLWFGMLVAGCCFAGAGNGPDASPAHLEAIIKSFEDAKDGKVLVVAHRGDFKNHPENSISSIVSAADFGADIVEIDVWPTKDRQLVLMHDRTIDRTTDGHGKVAELTVEQLKQFYLRDIDGNLTEEKIPTLQEALEALRGKCLINLDKSEYHLELCIDLVEKMGMGHQIIIKGTKDPAKVKALLDSTKTEAYYGPIIFCRKLSDNDEAYTNYKKGIELMRPQMIELVFFDEESSLISKQAQKLSDEYDVRVWINSLFETHGAGHVDHKALIDPDANWGWLVEQGADIIQSDESFALLEYLRSKGLHD